MTPLEERFKETIYLGGLSSRKDQDAVSCAILTEQIAIGFSKWKEKLRPSKYMVSVKDGYRAKTDSELFKDYMESLKP